MAKVTPIFLLAFLTKRVCYVAEPRPQPDYPPSCSGRRRTDGPDATPGPAPPIGFGCPDRQWPGGLSGARRLTDHLCIAGLPRARRLENVQSDTTCQPT